MTPAQLRAEGVLEIARIPDSAIVFVRTRAGLHLQHVDRVPTRRLDAWGIQRVLERFYDEDKGLATIAHDLGIDIRALRADLERAGYMPTRRELAQRARRTREPRAHSEASS